MVLLVLVFLPKPAATTALTSTLIGCFAFFIFVDAAGLVGFEKGFAGGSILVIPFNALQRLGVFGRTIRQVPGRRRFLLGVRRFFWFAVVVCQSGSFVQIVTNLLSNVVAVFRSRSSKVQLSRITIKDSTRRIYLSPKLIKRSLLKILDTFLLVSLSLF